ncbi:putative PQQ enzyme repeat [Desulfovibrio sp. DV]|uniref:aryl-sulfate sulfotransferase n=1 Tax=Desulfovibrio sp. DV TaxID=1844708 RepID=UPI00094B96E4|nr:aryl-sulfate sulfotransferase [Desulfovibrio sp. DV]OLN24831.1 putative PQQ enzyme repeat [Desulfovibrio sp. DV]
MTNISVNEQTVGLFTSTASAQPGLTLFSTMFGNDTWLIDNQGRVVNSWTSESTGAGPAYLLDNGDLIRSGIAYLTKHNLELNAPSGGLIEEFDWNGNLVWSYEYIGEDYCQHHDFCVMPNGNVLLIVWEYKSPAEAWLAGRDPSLLSGKGLVVDSVVEVAKTGPTSGQVVWEWHVWDHLVQDENPGLANYGPVANAPGRIDINYAGTSILGTTEADPDWNHINGIDYNAETDQIVLSVHTLNEVWVIDHSTTMVEAAGSTGGKAGHGGDILYRFGNPQAYGAGGASDQVLYGQHDAQWIAAGLPGAGNLLIFNNGWQSPEGEYSHVLEVALPQDRAGNYLGNDAGGFAGADVVWRYPEGNAPDFYASYVSGAQRLENGNTLISLGSVGTLVEVDAAGYEVWRYVNPDTDMGLLAQGEQVPEKGPGTVNNIFKAVRYGYDFAGFWGKDLTGGALLVDSDVASMAAAATRQTAGPVLAAAMA